MSLPALAARLPEPTTLRRWTQSLAVLDAVLSRGSGYRLFSHDDAWAPGEQRAAMSTGSGDEYSFTFTPRGTFGRGFAHDSRLSPWTRHPDSVAPGLLDDVPESLVDAVLEPAHCLDGVAQVTLALWWSEGADRWSYGVASDFEPSARDDGGSDLFDFLDGRPETYVAFARDYHEVALDLAAVQHVFAHRPLTEEVVRSLNPEVGLADLGADLRRIGYPGPS